MKLIRFHFTAPVHFSAARAEYDRSESTLHSDSLYAAIQQAWSILGKTDWIVKEPDFTLSSLFPFYRHDESSAAVYFFPRPMAGVDTKPDLAKLTNNIRFLDQFTFEKLLHEGELIVSDKKNLLGEFYHNDTDTSPKKQFLQRHVYTRNRVPRFQEMATSGDTLVYYHEKVFFQDGSGLFCLFDGSDAAFQRVKAALLLLQDEGLGTDRHSGNGQFELEIEEQFSLDLPAKAKYCLNLSLFCPSDAPTVAAMLPENDALVAFNLFKRGGWITNEPFLTFRKNSVYMFQEGSVFVRPSTEAETGLFIKGHSHDLRPQSTDLPQRESVLHPIYRSGKSIFLPFNAGKS